MVGNKNFNLCSNKYRRPCANFLIFFYTRLHKLIFYNARDVNVIENDVTNLTYECTKNNK